MRILLGTNQFQKDAGADVLLAEFALHCRKVGADVVLYANWDGFPMASRMQKARIPIVNDPTAIRPLDFDFVYFQHHVAGLFDYSLHPENVERTLIVFAKLASEGFMESSGWALENVLGDLIFARSKETASVVAAQGSTLPIHMFYNAAPGDLSRARERNPPGTPQHVFAVGVAPESDLHAALELLGTRFQVQHLARTGDIVKGGATAPIFEADIIVGLGQTVHYALAARIPVYVHNQFGGPGYLTAENFAAAEEANFSGRCTTEARDAQAIAQDLLVRYVEGRDFVRTQPAAFIDRYILTRHFDRLLSMPPTSNSERRERLASADAAVVRERYLAEHLRATFRKVQTLTRMTKG